MRSIYVRTSCGCSSPGIARLLDSQAFKAAALTQLEKGRKAPAITNVGRFVGRKHPALSGRIAKALRAHGRRIAAAVLKHYIPVEKAAGKTPSAADIIAALQSDWIFDDLDGLITPDLVKAYRQGVATGFGQVGFLASGDITAQVDKQAVAYAEKRGGGLIKDLAGTTEDDMRALLGRAIESGMSSDELSAAVEDLGAFGPARADVIARTELATAHVQGNVAGWEATGEVEGKQSILGDLHDVADQCDLAADAGVVPLDDDFADGYDFPPYHPNCVCDVLPVLKPAQTDEQGE